VLLIRGHRVYICFLLMSAGPLVRVSKACRSQFLKIAKESLDTLSVVFKIAEKEEQEINLYA